MGASRFQVTSTNQPYETQGPLRVMAQRTTPEVSWPAYGQHEEGERPRGYEGHPLTQTGALAGQGPAVLGHWDPLAVRATFNGSPDKVALFIGQVLNHKDRYGHLYTSLWDMVMAVVVAMEGEATDWVADLYGDHAVALGDVGLFLAALQERFEDSTRSQQAEGELFAVRERGRPVTEYIREFQRLAGKVRGWQPL